MFMGCGIALQVPKLPCGAVDESGLRRILRHQAQAGIDFVVPALANFVPETTPRASRSRVIEIAVEELRGRVGVLVPCQGSSTASMIRSSRELEALGVDGILCPPPSVASSQRHAIEHYEALAACVSIKIVADNGAGPSRIKLTPAAILRLSQIEGIVGIREPSVAIGALLGVLQQLPERFSFLGTNEAAAIALIAIGAKGIVSCLANHMPVEMAALIHSCLRGDFTCATRLHRKLLPELFEPGSTGNQLNRRRSM